MTNDDWLAVIILGGLMLSGSRIEWGDGWSFPVMDAHVGGAVFPAVISQEFRRNVAGKPDHLGVDVDFGRRLPPVRTPIVAARDGKVWSVSKSARGWAVVLDHGAPFATFYQHLDRVGEGLVKGVAVKAGQVLGTMGFDPTDPSKVRHLHFAVWYKGHGDNASVDPAGAMVTWKRSVWTPPTAPIT